MNLRLLSARHGPWWLALGLALLPLTLTNPFAYDLAIRVAINATIAVALNLLIGYTGQISIGHAGFFGLGAYASAILCGRYDWGALPAMVAGAAGVSLLAFGVARPILKLKGHYLAMATLGLGIILSITISNEAWLTGGPDGTSVPALAAGGWSIDSEPHWYILCAGLLLGMVLLAQRIVASPGGRALQAIDGSEIAAQVVGIDVARMKVAIFVFSAAVASLMGSLTAHHVGFVTPGVASFLHSIELMTMVVVGGMASTFGALVGALLITLLPQLLSSFEGWETMVFGGVLAATVVVLPRGIVPTLRDRLAPRASEELT
jgi:branched-chain amino acid transport system permease protein